MHDIPSEGGTLAIEKTILCLVVIASVSLSGLLISVPAEGKEVTTLAPDPIIREMIQRVTTSKFYSTTYDLQNFSTRYTLSQNISKAAQYIRDRFNASGLVTEFQEFDVSGKKVNNVIGTLKGSNASSNVTYVIGAHCDSTSGDSDPMTLAPGADDDGSGTAGVIEAADAMSKYEFDKTIKFIAFPGEEQGLLGSKFYVQNINKSAELVDGMVALDMIISANNQKAVTFHANTPSQWIGDRMADANTDYNLGVAITKRYNNPIGGSDHKSFWDGGYDAVLSIETYFSNYYHKKSDVVQNYPYPLGFEQGANITQMAMVLVGQLAGISPSNLGSIQLDKQVYPMSAIASVSVQDADLKGMGIVSLNVTSTTETKPEQFNLTENPPGSGLFNGLVQLEPGTPKPDHIVQVSDGDDVTAVYSDAMPKGDRIAVAKVDGAPPVISSVRLWDFTNSSVTVSWQTDESSNTSVFYGIGVPTLPIHIPAMTRDHYVWIRGLKQDTTYSIKVRSTDAVGNVRTDDNSGAYYKFKTGTVSYSMLMPNGGWVSSDGNKSFVGDDLFAGNDSVKKIWYDAGVQIKGQRPQPGYKISSAYFGLACQKRDYLKGANGTWGVEMLDSGIDADWANVDYNILDNALVDSKVGDIYNAEMKVKRWNTLEFSQSALSALQGNIGDGKVSFRVRTNDTSAGYADWDTGYDYGSMGAEYAPVLTLYLVPSFGSVEGYVKDTTSQPLTGALVSIASLSTTTGTNGYYVMDKVPSGQQTITASVKDHKSSTKSVMVVESTVNQVNFVLELLPGNVSGHVRSTSAKAIPGAKVSLVELSMTTTTDSSGSYSFKDVTPGTYTVLANASGYLDAYVKVIVEPGKSLQNVDLELERIITSGWISGTVTSEADGSPLGNVSIIIKNKNTGAIVAHKTTDTMGKFNATAPVGLYMISATLEGYDPENVTSIAVQPEQTSNVVMTMHRTGTPVGNGTSKPWFSSDSPILWLVIILLVAIVLMTLMLFAASYRRRKRQEQEEALRQRLYEWGQPSGFDTEESLRQRLAALDQSGGQQAPYQQPPDWGRPSDPQAEEDFTNYLRKLE